MNTASEDFEIRYEKELQTLKDAIRVLPFKGVNFVDITTALKDTELFKLAVKLHREKIRDLVGKIDKVVGMEARGFWFATVLAHELEAGFVPARKPEKLPAETLSQKYGLEYKAEEELQIHSDALNSGDRVLIVDDILATGGTADATRNLVERAGAEVVSQLFMVELVDLKGRERQRGRVESILQYTFEDLKKAQQAHLGRKF